MRTKRPFTLIEILIVMTLLAVALSALSLQISKALKGEKFERGVEQVMAKISLAQELMLDFHTDVRLELHQKRDVVTCAIKIDLELPERLEKSINRYSEIQGIDQMFFDNSAQTEIELCFDAALGATSKGLLTFISHGKEQNISLKGYPAQIKRGIDEQTKDCQADYPEEILSVI